MSTLTYDQLLDNLDNIPVFESRIDQSQMKEFVISYDCIMLLHLVFQKFFGPDFKAPGERPTITDKKRSALWGGIRENQTLYYLENDEYSNCAMLWPWEEGRLCTVKIVQHRKGQQG